MLVQLSGFACGYRDRDFAGRDRDGADIQKIGQHIDGVEGELFVAVHAGDSQIMILLISDGVFSKRQIFDLIDPDMLDVRIGERC